MRLEDSPTQLTIAQGGGAGRPPNHDAMKFSTQEEYGLRCLLQLARLGDGASMTITGISQAEGLSTANVAKLMRLLRLEGFVESVRGQEGGYTLARPAAEIRVADVLTALGGRLYEPGFCGSYSGNEDECTHVVSCSLRPLWHRVQDAIDRAISGISLADLLIPQIPTLGIELPQNRPITHRDTSDMFTR